MEFPFLCYLIVCLINLIYDEENRVLWCLYGIFLTSPTPQFLFQDAQLFLIYNYITQTTLFIFTIWLIKDTKYRIVLLIIAIFNLVNLFVFVYPFILPSLTSVFLFTTNRIYFETLLCLVNHKTNKKILQILSILIIGISYSGV